jgi:hypothetical protein
LVSNHGFLLFLGSVDGSCIFVHYTMIKYTKWHGNGCIGYKVYGEPLKRLNLCLIINQTMVFLYVVNKVLYLLQREEKNIITLILMRESYAEKSEVKLIKCIFSESHVTKGLFQH